MVPYSRNTIRIEPISEMATSTAARKACNQRSSARAAVRNCRIVGLRKRPERASLPKQKATGPCGPVTFLHSTNETVVLIE